ncbi:MAG: hypothetical protein D6675_05465 [Gemmatimonadetes bacterium]|nr:MAG: hypothetical protein D6675_05465 [Gemmatimonadota bacterium]
MLQTDRYLGLIWGQIIIGGILSGAIVYYVKPYFSVAFNRHHIRYILRYSLPLVPYQLSGIILAQFDRIMINNYIDSAATGLYSFAYNIGTVLNLFLTALLTAWTPDYYEYMKSKSYHQLDLDVDKMMRLVLICALFLMLFGELIGQIISAASYHTALHLIPIVVFGHIFVYWWQVWGRNLGFAYKTIWTSVIALSAGIINILLNSIYIPMFGYEASAYTTVISYAIMALGGWGVSKYVLQLHTTSLLTLAVPTLILVLVYGVTLPIASLWESPIWQYSVKLVILGLFSMIMVWKYRFSFTTWVRWR